MKKILWDVTILQPRTGFENTYHMTDTDKPDFSKLVERTLRLAEKDLGMWNSDGQLVLVVKDIERVGLLHG